MKKILRTFISFILIFSFALTLSACEGKENQNSDKNAKVKNGDVSYSSLLDAVSEADAGDTLKIESDVNDYKNIYITKPLKIEGVLSNKKIKPKFFGAITIDLEGAEDEVEIENIQIIHKGKTAEEDINNTLVGLNLVNGGLSLSSSRIALEKVSEADAGATGMIISRKAHSSSTMPIVIKGNSFGDYLISDNSGPSGAMLVKSNKAGVFENIHPNLDLLFKQNSFSFTQEGNQFVSIEYSLAPEKISYLVTSSSKELLDKLVNNQYSGSNTYVLKNSAAPAEQKENPIDILAGTFLSIIGNKTADLGSNTFKVSGTILAESELENATFEKTLGTASITLEKGKSESVIIK